MEAESMNNIAAITVMPVAFFIYKKIKTCHLIGFSAQVYLIENVKLIHLLTSSL